MNEKQNDKNEKTFTREEAERMAREIARSVIREMVSKIRITGGGDIRVSGAFPNWSVDQI